MYWGYKLRYLIKSAMKRSSKGTYLKVHAVKLGLLRRVSCEKGYWSIFYFHQSLQVYPQTYLWVIKFCSPPCVETQALWLQGGRADIDCPPFISPTHPPLHTCRAVASFRAGPSPVHGGIPCQECRYCGRIQVLDWCCATLITISICEVL